MAEEQLEPEIDTKGKPVTLPPGGRIVFKCLEVKEIKGSHTIVYYVKLDNEKAKIHESPPTKNNIFVGELQTVDIPVDKEKVIFEFDTKGLLGNSFMGEVRIDMTDLYNGYPHDHWYPLKGKGGKVDKKVTGKAHIQIMYLQPGAKPKHDEFSYALHSIINSGRVDLFEMKISDLGGQVSYPDDKGNTPLVHAAIHGAAPFIKLLIEHQASISEEKDSDGRNAIHLAALKGHTLALRYLVSRKGIDIDAPDNTKLRSTALHLAADQNHGDCVSILVKAGANINAQDDKGDTPLHFALQQKSGAVKSVTTLVDLGANIYARNNNSLAVWEVAHKKDLCYSSTTRHAFMKACGVIDQREFQIGETYPQTQRFLGTGLGPDWTKTTQFSLRSKKDISEVVVLAYSLERTDDCMQQVGFCVVKDIDSEHTLPSFQPEGIGFGSFESFKFNVEKEFTYTVITYTTKESDLSGEFGVTIFTPHGSIQPTVKEAKPWKNIVSVEGEWKGKTAAGTTPEDNPQFRLSCESKKETEVMVMLQQNTSDVSSIVFDDNRIVPAKYYIGLYVYSANMKTEITKSARWHNSKDVYLRLTMGGEEASELVIIPTTRKEGEELPFTISAYSDAKIALSGGKKKK